MKMDDMQLLARLAATGELTPVIDWSYPLVSAAEAHAYVDTGRKRGSVVLSVRPHPGARPSA
jgi:NADPH:quinone reductase-like Zn-dependent oxidoreductase